MGPAPQAPGGFYAHLEPSPPGSAAKIPILPGNDVFRHKLPKYVINCRIGSDQLKTEGFAQPAAPNPNESARKHPKSLALAILAKC